MVKAVVVLRKVMVSGAAGFGHKELESVEFSLENHPRPVNPNSQPPAGTTNFSMKKKKPIPY